MYLPFFAQWNPNPTFNTAIVIQPKSQKNIHCISDSKKGVISVWDDNRNSLLSSTDIYAQRTRSNGIEKWTTNGIPVCTAPGIQKSNNITFGGLDGSSIITWEDGRNGNYDIYAQKIDSSGNLLWGANGVVICNKLSNQKNPKIITDDAGGAIIVWEDSATFYFDIYAQRISSSGSAMWATNGVPICTASNQQQNPTLDLDGLGGAIITWQDKRSNVDYDIYAQKIGASGVIIWTLNGVSICNAVNTQSNPRIEPDGANGAIIGWVDKRNAIHNDIYLQRVSAVGVPQWSINGLAVCNAINNQSAIDLKYLGSSGILCTWKDERTLPIQIYTQLISINGLVQLSTNGLQLSFGLKALNPNTVKDGLGGAIIAWQDSSALGWDIKSQKINSVGSLQWPVGGAIVSNAIYDQVSVTLTSDGTGGAIYLWEDERNLSNTEIYAHHLFFTGTSVVGLNDQPLTSPIISVYPNPANEFIVFNFQNVDDFQNANLEIRNINGSSVLKVNTFIIQNQITLSNLNLANGLYHYTITMFDTTNILKGKLIISH
jgi:hypothetical protein